MCLTGGHQIQANCLHFGHVPILYSLLNQINTNKQQVNCKKTSDNVNSQTFVFCKIKGIIKYKYLNKHKTEFVNMHASF